MQRCYAILDFFLFTIFFCQLVSPAFSQTATLTRDLEPVVVPGSELSAFAGAPIAPENNELYLYAYDQDLREWKQIPFQFDEIGTRGDTVFSYFLPDDGLLDGNDELAFMAKDGGDQAANSDWIADEASRANERIEITITDPLSPAEMARVYLYRSATLTVAADLADYVESVPTTGLLGEDRVRTDFYEIAHSNNGFPVDLVITPEAGGNGQDLLDTFKLRAQLKVSLLPFPIDVTEALIKLLSEEKDEVRIIDGRVRVIRQLDASIQLIVTESFVMPPFFYYPYSYVFDINIPDISDLDPNAEILSARLSVDLNENAANMKFVSANNPEPGVTVDGVADAVDHTVDNVLPDNDWSYIGGPQGTIVHLFPLETTVGGARQLYYKDDASQEDSRDTGDKRSYGDTGIEVSGSIVPPVIFSYRGYFLSSAFDSNIGPRIAEFERMPLDSALSFEAQTFEEPTSVADGTEVPGTFELAQNFPNPFNPATEIRYQISERRRTVLTIYSILGERVRTLVDEVQPAGTYSVTWDGTDTSGQKVTSGIYLYRLQSGDLVASRKLILVK